MHTIEIETRQGRYLVRHNGDWSGHVIIEGQGNWAEIPSEVFLKTGKQAALDIIRSTVEDAIEKLTF